MKSYPLKIAAWVGLACSATAAMASDVDPTGRYIDTESSRFYLHGEAGYAQDNKTRAGHLGVNFYERKSATTWAYRRAIGYRYALTSVDFIGLELGNGRFGRRKFEAGKDDSAVVKDPALHLKYRGTDLMLVGTHQFGEHRFSARAGYQRTGAFIRLSDRDRQGTATDDVRLHRPAWDTQFKAGIGYEYIVKQRAGLTINYAHTWGKDLTGFREYISPGVFKNRPDNVPSLNSLLMGVSLYF